MKALRAVVSGSRVRYMQDGYDLDLTYITPRLIAMGYPATGVEKTYRNNISEVANFLNSHHPEAYRVFNLSERKYDYSKFDGRVTECGFPDHHPPPLQILLDIMNDMLDWTAKSSKHVVVVHCLAGKGRTGVVCSCYLLLVGFYGSIYKLRKEKEIREIANRSIRDFWNARGQGVRFPSQALYIYYFIKVLRRLGRTPVRIPPLLPAKKMILKSVVLHGIPDFEAPPRGGIIPFLQVLPAPSQHEKTDLLYNSSWQHSKFETYTPDPEGYIVFDVNCVIQGDILIRCFHASTSPILGKHFSQIFHFTFNTDFLRKDNSLLRMHREEIDEVGTSERFPLTFYVDCQMEMLTEESDRNSDGMTNNGSTRSNPTQEIYHPDHPPMPPKNLVKHASVPHLRADEPPIMGWLYKQGGFVKNWKKRWFVAREGKIMYYHGASDPTPLGTVDLRRVTVDVCDPSDINARNQCLHYFKIIPPHKDQRTYYFGADTEQEMVRWIRALGAQSAFGLTSSKHIGHDGRGSSLAAKSLGWVDQERFSDSRVAYGQSDHVPISTLSITSPPNDPRFSVTAYRSERGHNATELTYNMRQSAAQRESVPDNFHSSRGQNVSYTSYTDNDDEDAKYANPKTLPHYVASKPIDFEPIISENERATMLHEVENFGGHVYVYSADELKEITRLQKYLRTTMTDDKQSTQNARLRRCIALQRHAEAEELLVDVVIKFFPQLIDAMEYDPISFTQMVADSSASGNRVDTGANGVFF
ncbi:Phosphatidylinositol-3,4,5-trisphosphate 3-phosphatase, partial [Globisporangium splendens]